MTVTSVNTNTFISDTVILIRDDLRDNVTDPLSASRGTNQTFVMTSYPQRNVTYPIITVLNTNVSIPTRLGMQSTIHLATIPLEVRIWARNVKERDQLTQLVINRLRSVGLTKYVPARLFDFNINSAVNVDEEGDAGIHSRVIEVEYKFLLGAT